MLSKCLQILPLREKYSLQDLQAKIFEHFENVDLKQAQQELLAVEAPSTNSELILSVLQTIRTLIDRV